jgi:hypothetical protein
VIQFPNLNQGILIYAQNTTDDDELGKIIELRVSNEFDYKYRAKYFGIYLPTYKLSFGDIDRLLIKLPPIESDVVYPVYLERVKASNLFFENDFVYFYERLRNPQNIYPRAGAVYNITRQGFNFVSGKLYVDHETIPVKFKLHIPNITSHGKFHLYNPDTGYLMWTIEIDGLDIYINDVLDTTLENEEEIEMDIGFDLNSVRINIFETDELLYTTEDTTPLNTMPSISDSVMEIEGLDELTIDWMLCYKACFKNTEVYSVLEYTDFEKLVTSGQPLLTHISRFGMKVVRSDETEYELGIERTITDATLDKYGMKVVKRDIYSHINPFEFTIYNSISEIHPIELTIINECSYTHPIKFPVGGGVTTGPDTGFEAGMVLSKTELSDDGEFGIKAIKHNYMAHELGMQRVVALQEDYYWGMQGTHVKDFTPDAKYAMTVYKDSSLTYEEMLLIAAKKATWNVTIASEMFEEYVLKSTFTGGGIESK